VSEGVAPEHPDGARVLRADVEILANGVEGGANRRLALRLPTGWPGFAPGQFLMLSPGAVGAARRDDPLLPRPMAIYRVGEAGGQASGLEVLYRVTGRGTALLSDARTGERVRIVGPLGRGFPAPDPGGEALLVGGGTGIASLFELARRAAPRARVRVLLGARTASDLMGRGDFERLDAGLEVATEDGSAGRRGLVTELLERSLHADAVVYACGPTPMLRRAAALARAARARAFVSLENTMACGFGVCLGCAVPCAAGGYALVCRAGPVFAADAVAWEALP
jgi:dihydroorotate dehydrogenase electron transfer subunit